MGRKQVSLCLTMLIVVAIGNASPVSVTKTRSEIVTKLENYLRWMSLVSDRFQNELTSSDVHLLEQDGQVAHDQLMAALDHTNIHLNIDKSQISKNVLANLEQEMMEEKVEDENIDAKIVGMLLADSFASSQGAKLALASRLFDRIAVKLQTKLDEIKAKELYAEDLENIIENVSGAEMAFDSVVISFRSVEAITRLQQKRHKRSPQGRYNIFSNTFARSLNSKNNRFGSNGLNLGGGLSTDGSRLTYNRRRMTVKVTPHYDPMPRPPVYGATGGFEHRFPSSRGPVFSSAYDLIPRPPVYEATGGFEHRFPNSRGPVFGSATFNNRGRFLSDQVGIGIPF